MHTSSKFRTEASKLFWGKGDAYFLVEAQWLLNKAYPGQSFWDMAFLTNVQNIEIECRAGIRQEICVQRDNSCDIQHDLVNVFWASLKDKFPNVKKVILNHNEERVSWDEEPFPLALQLLLRACPQDIESSLLFLEKEPKPPLLAGTADWRTGAWHRCSFQLAGDGEWHKSEPKTLRQTILMPPKQFKGPVGRYIELKYQCYHKIPLQRFGLWPLMVEALDRHHSGLGRNASFVCPLSSCTASFRQAGEWTVHAAKTHYQEWKRLLEILPDSSVGARLKERSQALDRKTHQVQEQFKEIRVAWMAGDEATRTKIKRSWMEQLGSDAAWETKERGEESSLWVEFMQDLHSNYH
jgi:hypothetical protein